jgi:hypothetical protein
MTNKPTFGPSFDEPSSRSSDAESAELLARLELFHGQATPGECRLYARIEGCDPSDGWQLSGTLLGPECRFAQTLPATYRWRDLGPGRALLAEAFLPDPCFWSPQLPHLYRASLELRHRGMLRGTFAQSVGVRSFGARRRDLSWEGKRWVLRGVLASESTAPNLAPWHAGPTTMVVDNPSDELCRGGTAGGVLIAARLSATSGDGTGGVDRLAAELTRLARWACVGVAIIDAGSSRTIVESSTLTKPAGNILLAQYFPAGSPVVPGAWAKAAAVTAAGSGSEFAAAVADCPVPVIAMRTADQSSDVATGRQRCDELQRDLAPAGDYAGYIT